MTEMHVALRGVIAQIDSNRALKIISNYAWMYKLELEIISTQEREVRFIVRGPEDNVDLFRDTLANASKGELIQ